MIAKSVGKIFLGWSSWLKIESGIAQTDDENPVFICLPVKPQLKYFTRPKNCGKLFPRNDVILNIVIILRYDHLLAENQTRVKQSLEEKLMARKQRRARKNIEEKEKAIFIEWTRFGPSTFLWNVIFFDKNSQTSPTHLASFWLKLRHGEFFSKLRYWHSHHYT